MVTLADFLRPLLDEGEVVFTAPPRPNTADHAAARQLLGTAFADYRLHVAGPPPDFDAAVAVAAAEFLRLACWFLVSHQDPPDVVAQCLQWPDRPTRAAHHLSADLVLRYLPQLHRRARALGPDDRLTVGLAEVLRRWPLSGVLADVDEPPTTPLDFDGHAGLLLLYAERLAQKEKPAWVPAGRGFEYVELVFHELGKQRSPLLATPPTAAS